MPLAMCQYYTDKPDNFLPNLCVHTVNSDAVAAKREKDTDLEPADHFLFGDFVRDLLDPRGVGHLPIRDSSFRVSHPL